MNEQRRPARPGKVWVQKQDVAEWAAAARDEGYTFQELSEMCGLAPGTLSAYVWTIDWSLAQKHADQLRRRAAERDEYWRKQLREHPPTPVSRAALKRFGKAIADVLNDG